MAARSKVCAALRRSGKGIVGSNSSWMCVCLCIVYSHVGIGIATGCSAHRRLMNDLEPKIKRTPVILTWLDAHVVNGHSNKQHNHVDTGNESL